MFKGCSSLISLPNISNWNINNYWASEDPFGECISLIFEPNFKSKKLNF